MSAFVPALRLSAGFHRDVVGPLLDGEPHSAALLGWGSDILGYDTERSTDHGWGPRLLVFVADPDRAESVSGALDARLPSSYRGWPVRFGWDDIAARHWVTVVTLPDWLTGQLGVDASAGFAAPDWLVTPQQRLLGVVAGAVHTDGLGVLGPLRRRLAWFPDQVWRWMLACQWHRLAQEEAFVARTAEVGDGLGSAVTAARQVRELMRLALLLERRYAPYQKWLGTAFARMPHDDDLPARLDSAVRGRPRRRAQGPGAAPHPGRSDRGAADGHRSVPRPAGQRAHGRPVRRRLPGDGHGPVPARAAADRQHRPAHRQHGRAQRPAPVPPDGDPLRLSPDREAEVGDAVALDADGRVAERDVRPQPITTGTRSIATSSRRPSSSAWRAIVPAVTATIPSPAISCAAAIPSATPVVTKRNGASGCASTH